MLHYEREAWKQGHRSVAGLDEAGRGPLAGPVVVAAVRIERPILEREQNGLFQGVNDSKQLSSKRRKTFFDLIQSLGGIDFFVEVGEVAEIDRYNILRATQRAMARCLQQMNPVPDLALVDGLPVNGLPCASRAIVKGDSKSLLIAAASIMAKVTRDQMMCELDRAHPEYGFAQHKGYGTRQHLEALREYGPSPHHRTSFAPVRTAQLLLAGFEDGMMPMSADVR